MAEYKLKVTTGSMQYAGTMDRIYIILFGTEGQSERTELDNFGIDFQTGTTRTYTIKSSFSLGKVLLVRVEKDPFLFLPEDEWYCAKIVVTTPEGDDTLFPCYRWIKRGEEVELRGGKAMKGFEEEHALLIEHRKKELELRKNTYLWAIVDDKLLHKSHFNDESEMQAELRFSASKSDEIRYGRLIMAIELKFKGMVGSSERWDDIEDMKRIFWFKKTEMSEYVSEHWKEDDFFGFQFLNGVNPNVIERCSKLPPNFPVTEEMVKLFLRDGSTLKTEMEKGNIFLCDQKIMEGIPAWTKDGNSVHMTAGLCLFYMNPESKLMPIAIQLYQQPSEQNPIFLPSDPETDWLLAKLYVRSSDFLEYEAVHHLMNTHYLAEVFAVATLRCLPVIHPLYKSTIGLEGLKEVMHRAQSKMTYSSLCLPENITARGLESIPNFYYRDDGLKLWNIINGFVRSVVEYYYPSDSDVREDTELQEWITEIFTHGFLGNKLSGFPACFNTAQEVVKFITVVIFTVSVQHAAVNNGQFDYSWVPNGSLQLLKPPPTTKGQSNMKTILDILPNVGHTVKFAASAWLLTDKYADEVPLGTYPEERFDEPDPKRMIKEFQAELSYLSEEIAERNHQLKVPYSYLSPTVIENSVTI
ncbi:hydroperoxide isomerase ALOXE3-like isoform 2-T5 [Odontesthes bonariensis]|uniref:hydroperoxide isomerase ALOXE3-like isoform X2 n=1 Tax=Odontesthes bonariensis TaxID=219752 RepID=UPI003F58F9E2